MNLRAARSVDGVMDLLGALGYDTAAARPFDLADVGLAGTAQRIRTHQAKGPGVLVAEVDRLPDSLKTEALMDGRMPSEDQRHGLRVARDNAQQAYVRAQAGVVDFVDTMRSFKLEDTSRAELKDRLTAAERMLEGDGPMLLFAAYVLHENRLLRLAVESDPTDAEALRSRTVSQRENMAKDLRALDKAIRRIALLRESELDERYVWFRSNDGEWARIKPMKRSYKKLKPFLERGSNLMPEPPPPSPPFIAEIRRAPSGELEMASAVLTAPANPS